MLAIPNSKPEMGKIYKKFLTSSQYLNLIEMQSIYEVLEYSFSIDYLQRVTGFYVCLFTNAKPFSLENSSFDVQPLKLTI